MRAIDASSPADWRRPFVVAAGGAFLLAMAGGALTQVGPWYRGLEKAALNPPDWLFAPAWTIIYALTVWAIVVAWRAAPSNAARRVIAVLFVVNAGVNVLWSYLFFTAQRPDWALIDVAFLWLSILAPLIFVRRFAPRAALLLAPYLLWVSFASYLNFEVVRLNPPFGA
ncbi:MAG: TspO/MBR family protein [Parvularculaceae bacterium]